MRAVVVAAACALTTGVAGCGSSGEAPGESSVSTVREALVARLESKDLSYRWVACSRTARVFAGRRVVRCNVNFGDPHIEVYCGVVLRGRLRAAHESPAIPCGRPGS